MLGVSTMRNGVAKTSTKWLWGIATAMVLLLASCSPSTKDEPIPSKSETQAPKQGYRCLLEVWCDQEIEIDFWSVTWCGGLTHDGKAIPSNQFLTAYQDLGKYPIKNKYYKTEFVSSEAKLLSILFRYFRLGASSDKLTWWKDELKVKHRARYFLGDKQVSEIEEVVTISQFGFFPGTMILSPYKPLEKKKDK